LLEDVNISHLALLLELIPRGAVHVIGAYAVRAAVGGFARHSRLALYVDLVLREVDYAGAVLEAAQALGMTAVSHSWGLELKKVDPRLEKYYVKLEFGYPDVPEADFRYDPELTYEGCVESAGALRRKNPADRGSPPLQASQKPTHPPRPSGHHGRGLSRLRGPTPARLGACGEVGHT